MEIYTLSTITDINTATFAFSVPKPRLTAGGFKTVKPRLLRQVNTAKLKRPGLIKPRPPSIRPPSPGIRRPM